MPTTTIRRILPIIYNAVGGAFNEHIVNEAARECDSFEFLRFALARIAA